MKNLLILFTVVITIVSSLILDFGAEYQFKYTSYIFITIAAALGLNFTKFLIWGYIHKNYDLTKSYPLTAIFFPLIFIIACLKGEADFSTTKIIGISVILFGIFIFEYKKLSLND